MGKWRHEDEQSTTEAKPRRPRTRRRGKHLRPCVHADENVHAIKRWENAILLARSRAERVSDWIACTAGRGPVLVLHVVWFGAWVTINAGAIRGIRPFDPFPFPFLTMTVSLETPVRNEGGLDTDDA